MAKGGRGYGRSVGHSVTWELDQPEHLRARAAVAVRERNGDGGKALGALLGVETKMEAAACSLSAVEVLANLLG